MPKTIGGTLRKSKEHVVITVEDAEVDENGFPDRYVTDLKTGQRYSVTPKSCGIRRCKCENWLYPVDAPGRPHTPPAVKVSTSGGRP